MIRIALLVQYDGTRFNGWQIQNYGRTVQGEIERGLEVLTKEKIRITSSGRTDTGVHALGQVIHFDVKQYIDLRRLCVSLNGILDHDISIKNAYVVPSDFHARFSAIQREYLYLIYNHYQKSPFIINRAMWIGYNLDVAFLQRVSEFLIGENDYASFCKKTSSKGNTIRRIDEIEITKQDELVLFKIKGNAFLHNMIRSMIGTIIDMYKDNRDPDYINEIIAKRDRIFSGVTVPPCGLYLNKISYDPSLSTMESAF